MTEQTSIPEADNLNADARTPRRSRGRTILLSSAGVLAALVLVGGGAAVGAAIADDEDDDDRGDATSLSQMSERGDAGADSADSLIEIIRTASEAAEGVPTAIEAAQGGAWEVQFTTARGDESDVRVGADGAVVVVSTEPADLDESAPVASLDETTVRSLVSATLAHTDGEIVHLDVDDNAGGTFEATVLTDERTLTELSLDATFAVTGSERDDSDD